MLVSDSLVDDRGCLTDRSERKPFPCDVNLQRRGPLDSTLNERLGQRVFHILLQSPPQRPCPVTAVCTRFFEDPLACFRRDDYLDLPVDERVVHLTHKQIDNAQQVVVAERVEDNDFVQAVEKLRIERPLYFVHHHIFHAFQAGFIDAGQKADGSALLQMARTQVGSHDDDGVAKIHGIAETVRQLAVFKDLQKYIEDIRVRLLDFVQENDRV